MRRLFVALGDATKVNTRGGSPYYIGRAGLESGFFQKVGALRTADGGHRRWLWNLGRLLRFGEKGGYQFSSAFAERLFSVSGIDSSVDEVVSQFPLFPPDSWLPRVKTSYYIDATLKQNLVDYGLAKRIGRRMQEQMMTRERHRYQDAERVVCMCRWAARSVVEDYGTSAHKVHVVAGGANLDEASVRSRPVPAAFALTEPLRLGFLGKNFERKNLSFLIRIAELIERHGFRVEVLAAGFRLGDGPTHPLLHNQGFLDKGANTGAVMDFMQRAHFGCLFSHAEASPRSNLEFIRLGVPVLTWDVGGMADTVPNGLGRVFLPRCAPEDVADALMGYLRKPSAYLDLRRSVQARAQEVTWKHAIAQFQAIWSGSSTYSYATLTDG